MERETGKVDGVDMTRQRGRGKRIVWKAQAKDCKRIRGEVQSNRDLTSFLNADRVKQPKRHVCTSNTGPHVVSFETSALRVVCEKPGPTLRSECP